MKQYYKMKVAGCDRELPLCPVNEHLDIAAFIMFGDIEVTEKAAKLLLEKCPEHDVLVTAEAKGIPLCYEMARQGCRNYCVARKGLKVYMTNPLEVTVKSITTENVQKLYLSDEEVKKIQGKRVLIVDDVISTGESLNALMQLVEKAGGNIVGMAAVLAEGDAQERDDIVYLDALPLFVKNNPVQGGGWHLPLPSLDNL
ncbi:MAG: phosphoribosyltransferase family protein [[Clostridium] leptum]